VREILGVRLPPYYGKVQEGVAAVFTGGDGRFRVDFNRPRRPGQPAWRPPELGLLQGPVAHFMKHHPTQPLSGPHWRSLAGKWEAIRQVRNDVCHPYPVSQERATVIRAALRDLQDEAVFEHLVRLKRHLRGDAPGGEGPPPPPPVRRTSAPAGPAQPRTTAVTGREGPAQPARKARWWQFWK
jgi:hypothetical protein